VRYSHLLLRPLAAVSLLAAIVVRLVGRHWSDGEAVGWAVTTVLLVLLGVALLIVAEVARRRRRRQQAQVRPLTRVG
jgi:hypothetical protein